MSVPGSPRLTDRLRQGDLRLLSRVAGRCGHEVDAERLRSQPELVGRLIDTPEAAELILSGHEIEPRPLLGASPLLVFLVGLGRCAADLRDATYVEEWVGHNERLPVFGVEDLVELLDDTGRRLFLAEVLASFTKVASGSVRVRTSYGWRRRRWNELDPIKLAGLLDVLPEAAHPGVHRRLGDLALLLTGVFPDHTASRRFRDLDLAPLALSLEATGLGAGTERLSETLQTRGSIGLLEYLGPRWYQLARRAPQPAPAELEAVAERFGDARRVLNHLTDHYLFEGRVRLYPGAA